MRAILAVAGLVLLTALVLLGIRGSGDAGDPTAMDTSTESPTDGSTAADGDSDPLEPTDGPEDATPSPTDGPTDAATDDEATEPDDVSTAGGDRDDTDAEPAGDQAGDDTADESSSSDGSGDTGSDGDGSAADDVDDMPDTGVAGILPLTGLALTGLALRLRR